MTRSPLVEKEPGYRSGDAPVAHVTGVPQDRHYDAVIRQHQEHGRCAYGATAVADGPVAVQVVHEPAEPVTRCAFGRLPARRPGEREVISSS